MNKFRILRVACALCLGSLLAASAFAANTTAVVIAPPAAEPTRDSAGKYSSLSSIAVVSAAQAQSSKATFVSMSIGNGGSFNIPPGTVSVDGFISFTWTSNNAGVAKFDVKDVNGTIQQTYYAGNYGFNDGGSGSAWWLPVSIKVQPDSAVITMTQIYGSNSLSWNIASLSSG